MSEVANRTILSIFLQLWNVHRFENQDGLYNLCLKYQDYLIQRYFFPPLIALLYLVLYTQLTVALVVMALFRFYIWEFKLTIQVYYKFWTRIKYCYLKPIE